ncbi:MFS transporter [Actinoplanes sp. LDG1-06]|uniref:MFS transporter n=1 Tax=Paractinoplanes ovalisporus TaxID=2810368 RepID=A0ABS2AGD4_9ACTN|nr:MFS transporter [Actinoplanes ovalisporus]MBM2618873.1 MFS transporter [Actinoplanes ovalisporus]
MTITSLVRADTTLRRLLTVTLIGAVGRGVFLPLTALYLTTVAGLPALTVGVALTCAGAVGVGSSLVFGHLADRWSPRRLLVALQVAQGAGMIAYVAVRDVPTLILVASLVTLAQQGGTSVRSAAIGRAFPGDERVRVRAAMRTVTNFGIAAGTAVAAVPLAIGTGAAYRVTMGCAGILFLGSSVLLLGLSTARVSPPAAAPVEGGLSPYRNRVFLLMTALSGVFGLQFGLIEVAVPLWVVGHTRAPHVLASLLLLLNTVVVVVLQVRMSRGTGDLRGAGRVMTRAAWLMAGSCLLFAAGGWMSPWLAVGTLVAAALAQAFAEILSSAATWNMSFELADPRRLGAYQGVYGTGYALAAMVAPTVVTVTAIEMGTAGWVLLAVMFLGSGFGLAVLARSSAASVAPASPSPVSS